MGSDRARISYDEQRQYRAVIMQQGRVTVEADWNEEWQIINEEIRKDVLDIVGPCGTPDDGYRIMPAEQSSSPIDPYDFSVTKGTMYVGGLRAYLPQDVLYSDQSDWIDNSLLLNSSPVTYPEQEFIYLSLREQEVSAVEDTVLREVALGGPDTAQRLRLVQRIKRMSTNAQDCATALEEAVQQWASCGYTFVPRDMRLLPSGTLKVGFQNVVTTPNPCDPQSTGGYLGADNQLIRIQISQADATKNNYSLLWGYDNASFLYQITAVDGSDTTFKLASVPVDSAHQPLQGQAVEILRSAVKLDADSQKSTDYMASATGFVTTLQTTYDPSTSYVVLNDPLPPEFTDSTETPVLFLRAWEEELSFTLGTAVDLGNANSNTITGLQVTIRVDKGEILGVGTYWQIAVRPSTPTEVYPHRYLESPQPPDGPRIWVCPLGVIEWDDQGNLNLLADCRNHFDNLVDLTKRNLGGCCNVTLRPEDITESNSLQSILDKYSHQEKITVCLTPGTYTLPQPLQLGPEHSNLTLECCHKGAIIQAKAGSEDQFLDGLIVLNGANNVTFQGLHFTLPLVPFFNEGDRSRIAGLNAIELEQIVDLPFLDLQVSIGIRPLDCNALTIKDCYFEFPSSLEQSIFGSGIFAGGTCQGIAIQGNQFVGPADTLQVTKIPFSFLFGYLLTPTTQLNQGVNNNSITVEAIKARRVSVLLSTLQDALFQDNLFTGLSSAVFIYADAGIVKFERNTVQECYAGFWLLSLSSLAYVVLLINDVSAENTQQNELYNWAAETAQDSLIQIGSVIARGYPLPKSFDMSQAIQIAARPIAMPPSATATTSTTAPAEQTLFNKAFSFSSVGPASASEEEQVKLNAESITSTSSISTSGTSIGGRFKTLHFLLSTAEYAALTQRTQPSRLHLALHLSDNDISALVSVLPPYTVKNVLSSTALVVWDWDIKQEPDKTVKESDIAGAVVVPDTTSTMIMSANKIRNQSNTMLTAFVLMIDYCAITGNLVLNEERNADEHYYPSLILVPASSSQGMRYPSIAVTGNVFQGAPSLPDRGNVQSPMNTWDFLNTIIP